MSTVRRELGQMVLLEEVAHERALHLSVYQRPANVDNMKRDISHQEHKGRNFTSVQVRPF